MFIRQVWAVEWNSGSVIRVASCSSPPRIAGRNMSCEAMAFEIMLAWVSSAPLAWPDVPDV